MSTNEQIAWGDESVRVNAPTPMYLLGASIFDYASNSVVIEMGALKPAHAKKVHWREMSINAQRNSLELLGNLEHSTTIIVATPLNGKKQERARRKCLESLLIHLEANNVTKLILESRGESADKKDIDFLLYLRRAGILSAIDLRHTKGKDDVCLCIPDQILGAYGDMTSKEHGIAALEPAWNKVAESVKIIEVAL